MENYTLADPTKSAPLATASNGATPPPQNKKKFIMIGGIIVGFLVVFLMGITIGGMGKKNTAKTANLTPTKAPKVTPKGGKVTVTPQPENTRGLYLPGKEYYDDSVVIISKTEPRLAVQLSVSRFEQTRGFTQYTKVNYFNGTTWSRENLTTEIQRSGIINNPLIRLWNMKTKPAASSRDLGALELTINTTPVSFSVSKLSYDISAQSYPGYTKFNYFGEGKLKVPNDEVDAYMYYSQTYSADAFTLSFLGTPQRLESDWFVFWDDTGNAYYFDSLSSTDTSKPFENYLTSAIYYSSGTSTKAPQPSFNNSSQSNRYSAVLANNPTTQLLFTLTNPLNKSPEKSYRWQTGIITGTVQAGQAPVNGIGLFEEIHKTR